MSAREMQVRVYWAAAFQDDDRCMSKACSDVFFLISELDALRREREELIESAAKAVENCRCLDYDCCTRCTVQAIRALKAEAKGDD